MSRKLIMGIVNAKYPPPSAGHQYSMLHWLIGFKELGWDVWIVENISSSACKDHLGQSCPVSSSVNFACWKEFVRRFGFEGRETLFIDGVGETDALRDFAKDADLFLNYAGQFHQLDVVQEVRCKVYLDVDPGYTQTWAVAYGCNMNFHGHDRFITIGATMGSKACRIPDTGHEWIPTLPPVTPNLYVKNRTKKTIKTRPWTTITHWYGANEVAYNSLVLKPKRESFLQVKHLPKLVEMPFVVASDIERDWEDYDDFLTNGWNFASVKDVCSSFESYSQFIEESAGEIGVAKHGYVATQSGWISDRSLSYLAHGRPVVALDTGWTHVLGDYPGLRAYTCEHTAAKQIKQVMEHYELASASAIELANEVFSYHIIIPHLIERLKLA